MWRNDDSTKGSKYNLSKEVSHFVAKKIEVTLVSIVYSQSVLALCASLACAGIIFVGLFNSANFTVLVNWAVIFIVITLLRLCNIFLFHRTVPREDKFTVWRNLFVLGALLGGAAWGFVGIGLYPMQSGLAQTLIVLVLAGTTAGAVPVLAPVLPAAIAFIVAALAPLLVNLIVRHGDFLFISMLSAYLLYLLLICRKTHATIRQSVALQYENIALLSNLSEAKNQLELINKKLEIAATHDPLTNVPNRNLFIDNFMAAIETAKQNKQILALLYIDLDNFKMVNDLYGHHVGDQLLLILTERLEEMVESSESIARLGGDEFTIIVEGIVAPPDIAKLAKKICRMVAEPININGKELKVSASIGIGIYPIDGDDAETLLNVADKAMYHVKERGGNNFRFNVTLLAD